MDNRVPLRASSKAGLMLWHGFGWKGPNDEEEFAWLHRSIARAFGDAKRPNPHFRWEVYGPWDQKHRTEVSGFHPDNIMDLQVADVLLTNYSSIANLFYATGRPTVHIYPVRSADEAFMWRKLTAFGITKTKVKDARFVWKLDPEDHGGLMARSFDETLAALDTAIDNPGCCQEAADDFLARHMHGADGRSGARALASLRELTSETMQT